MGILFGLFLATQAVAGWADTVPTKAEAYNNEVSAKLAQLASATDSTQYYLTVADALLLAKECDRYDAGTSFLALNQNRLMPLRDRMIRSVMHSNSYTAETLKRLINAYVETAGGRLFSKADKAAGDVVLNVAEAAYAQGNHDMANYYADVAMRYSANAERAAEVKGKCLKERLQTREDSTKYLVLLLELHEQCPANRTFFSLLLDHLEQSGDTRRLIAFADDELRKDSTNVRAWVVKAEENMNCQRWEKAISAFEKALHYEPHLVAAQYNLGVCYSARAIELKDSLVDGRGRLSSSNRAIVRKYFDKARVYLEQVREQDPNEKTLPWRKPLYQAYYAIGMRGQARKLKKEMNED